MVPSSDPDASHWPSGENAVEITSSRWPSNVSTHRPDAVSQISTVLLSNATRSPSGENPTDQTQLLLANVCIQCLDTASQILIVLSYGPDTTCWPLGENATELTKSLWPSKACIQRPDVVSQILIVLSLEPDTTCWPLGENATDSTVLLWPNPSSTRFPSEAYAVPLGRGTGYLGRLERCRMKQWEF